MVRCVTASFSSVLLLLSSEIDGPELLALGPDGRLTELESCSIFQFFV